MKDKIYLVTITHTVAVVAKSKDEAYDIAGETMHESNVPDSYSAVEIKNAEQLPDGASVAWTRDDEFVYCLDFLKG